LFFLFYSMRTDKNKLILTIMLTTLVLIWLTSAFFMILYPYANLVKVYGEAFAVLIRALYVVILVALGIVVIVRAEI